MSEDDGNGGGCCGCLDCVRSSDGVRSVFTHLKFLRKHITEHYIRYSTIVMCFVIMIVSWEANIERDLSKYITVYCSSLLFCSGVTFATRGCLNKCCNTCCNTCCPTGRGRTRSNQMTVQERQQIQPAQVQVQEPESGIECKAPVRTYTEEELKDLTPWEKAMVLKGLVTLEEVKKGKSRKMDESQREVQIDLPAEPPSQGHSLRVTADFHRAELDPSESSNSVEPSTSSDDPLPQPVPSALGKSVKQSSTDPSTRSTSIKLIDEDTNGGQEGAPPSPSSDETSPQPGPSGLCRTQSLSSSS